MFCSRAPGYYLWTRSAAACMALRVALAKIAAVMPLRKGHWGSRSGAGGTARAVWCAGVAGSRTGIVWEGVIITAGLLAGLTAFLLHRWSLMRAALALS